MIFYAKGIAVIDMHSIAEEALKTPGVESIHESVSSNNIFAACIFELRDT
jgi:hypothetical protein